MNYLDQNALKDTKPEEKPMSMEEAQSHMENFSNWELLYEDSKGYHIRRCFSFDDADKSREFINQAKSICKDVYPFGDITLNGTEACVVCYTPQLNGLHTNDFIIAAHVEELYTQWDDTITDNDKVTQASYESFPASDPPGY